MLLGIGFKSRIFSEEGYECCETYSGVAGSSEIVRHLLATIVEAVVLYAVFVWANIAFDNERYGRILLAA